MSDPQVTVVGAGIVGVCSAAWLQREGFKVTLIDAGPVGEGSSFGNAGNLSPGAVAVIRVRVAAWACLAWSGVRANWGARF